MSSDSASVPRKLTVLLVRHGETDSNVNRILQGSLDTPLNANGKVQAREAAHALVGLTFDRAHCSSLSRCVQTAEPIVSGRAMRTSYSNQIWEKDLGILEGMEYGKAMDKMQEEHKVLDNYGEGQSAFIKRLMAFWDSQVLPFAADSVSPERMLIVTHGGCIATLCRELARRGYEAAPDQTEGFPVPRSEPLAQGSEQHTDNPQIAASPKSRSRLRETMQANLFDMVTLATSASFKRCLWALMQSSNRSSCREIVSFNK